MTCRLLGRLEWGAETGEDWHRTYNIKWLVETDNPLDGPERAMSCPALPSISSFWRFGNDNDPYAFCWPNWSVAQLTNSKEPNYHFVVGQTYTTKPFPSSQNQQQQSPFSQPAQVSGTFVKYTEEATLDRNGKVIKSSSHERIRGPSAEFDANRPSVTIEQNYPGLGLNVFSQMIDTVNDSAMWGLQKRMIKLSNVQWNRSLWNGGFFYTRQMYFDINYKTFDRKIPDVGTQVLVAGGNKLKAADWRQVKDVEGNVIRNQIYYKADGSRWSDAGDPDGNTINKITIEYYSESNLLSLGVPTNF